MNLLQLINQRGDIIIAVSMVSVLGVMILPVPPFVLDMLLSFSISLSIVILVTGVYVKRPLELSVFPSILLMTTLYRLALNIASTRLILLNGSEGIDAAGQVIKSFGNFVVGGNYAVGLTIFLILVIINFVVITKGSVRIAEVAARFTLDAMPGKQMAIDADLNTGIITEAEARQRRLMIARESDFYGAMDGASKFVRGDAIAGLAIMAINIVGGFIIGVVQKGMPLASAAKTYTILTIGDGLVSQIPALLMSTAAGIVVSRAGNESSDLGKDITKQILINPKALGTAAGILVALGLVPGLPHVPFFLLSAASGGLAYVMAKPETEPQKQEPSAAQPQEQPLESFREIEPLTLEIGYGLIPFVNTDKPELLNKIKAMRRQLATDLGFIVPSIHIKDNLQLRPNEYSFMIRRLEVARGEIMAGHHLAVASGDQKRIEGVPTKEPAFGLPAYWITDRELEKAQAQGYMVVDTATVIATHITELIKTHAWELLTRAEVQTLLDAVSKNYPKIVDELIPMHLTLGGVQRVLQNLLRERVPIFDLVTVLETLLDQAPTIKDLELLTEYARQALARFITKQYCSDGSIRVMPLDSRFEQALMQGVETGAVNPDVITKLIKTVETTMKQGKLKGAQPIILCSAQVRRFLRKITERILPSMVVLSSAELLPSVRIITTGVLRYED